MCHLLEIRMTVSTKMLEILKIQKYSKILLDLKSWKNGPMEIKQYFLIIITHFISAIKKAKHLLLYEHTFH